MSGTEILVIAMIVGVGVGIGLLVPRRSSEGRFSPRSLTPFAVGVLIALAVLLYRSFG